MRLVYKMFVIIIFLVMCLFAGCKAQEKSINIPSSKETDRTKIKERNVGNKYKTWDEVVNAGKNKTVNFYMWSGNEKINKYIDGYVVKNVKEKYGITLKREDMDASKYIPKFLNEKEKNVNTGNCDLIWINAESFKNAKQSGLIWGPFTNILPNQIKYYDLNSIDVNYDTGLVTEGYEALWGKTQLVLNYNTDKIKTPPKNYQELLDWAKKNSGKFTYPKFEDSYVGKTFVRNAYYELTKDNNVYKENISKEEFNKKLEPVKAYFNELNNNSWKNGKEFPTTLKQQEEMFRNGDIIMSMSFDIFKVKTYNDKKIYPNTIENYVFDTGEITNPHYLAIPFNSQNKAASMLVIDFLQSPDAQLEKIKDGVWGDLPALDVTKLDENQKKSLADIEKNMKISIDTFNKKSLPEMKLEQIEWFNEYFTKK